MYTYTEEPSNLEREVITYIHTYMHTQSIHVYIHRGAIKLRKRGNYIHTYIHTCIHTQSIHVYIHRGALHTYIHTYIHT
jgi:hypothetical protein